MHYLTHNTAIILSSFLVSHNIINDLRFSSRHSVYSGNQPTNGLFIAVSAYLYGGKSIYKVKIILARNYTPLKRETANTGFGKII